MPILLVLLAGLILQPGQWPQEPVSTIKVPETLLFLCNGERLTEVQLEVQEESGELFVNGKSVLIREMKTEEQLFGELSGVEAIEFFVNKGLSYSDAKRKLNEVVRDLNLRIRRVFLDEEHASLSDGSLKMVLNEVIAASPFPELILDSKVVNGVPSIQILGANHFLSVGLRDGMCGEPRSTLKEINEELKLRLERCLKISPLDYGFVVIGDGGSWFSRGGKSAFEAALSQYQSCLAAGMYVDGPIPIEWLRNRWASSY